MNMGRGPRGPCGLKFNQIKERDADLESRPARALWIEIVISEMVLDGVECRGPRGPCGLKSEAAKAFWQAEQSRPARALWIEIAFSSLNCVR